MVPAAYVALDAFPLTPSGKVDRKALPAPNGAAFTRHVYEAPQGEIEQALARIWGEVLGVDRVGRHDNFFELGGHSLLVVRATNRAKKSGFHVNVAESFKFPTVASLAEHVRGRGRSRLPSSVIAVREADKGRPLFLIHEFSGADTYFPVLAQHLDGNFPIYGLSGVPLDQDQLTDMRALAARLITLMQEVRPNGPYRIAGWSFGGLLAYEVAQQLMRNGESVDFIGIFDMYCPKAVRLKRDFSPEYSAVEELVGTFMDMAGSEEQLQAIKGIQNCAREISFAELAERLLQVCDLPNMLAAADAEELERFCVRKAAHRHAYDTYEIRPMPMTVHIFAATGSTHDLGDSLGWEALLPRSSLRIKRVPGTHLSIMDAHVQDLGQAVSQALSELDLPGGLGSVSVPENQDLVGELDAV
jgi:arthrofactin-type cyclic lipopeptide synthetase C